MELIKARDVAIEDLYKLVDNNKSIDTENLLRSGYVMKQADHLEGCFVLERNDANTVWLRQMYVMKDAVTSLPVLLEAVLALAEKKHAANVVIHSHQSALDTILEALQFFPQTEASVVDKSVDITGKWWVYKVS